MFSEADTSVKMFDSETGDSESFLLGAGTF